MKKKGGITHITTKFTTTNKETKIIVNSAWVKEHCLFKDASLYQRKSDYGKMMDMLCSYTMAGKNKHDDVPMAWQCWLSMLRVWVVRLLRSSSVRGNSQFPHGFQHLIPKTRISNLTLRTEML